MRIISGRFRNRKLKTPKGQHTRPTPEALREKLFNICHEKIQGANVLDLFAGSGALGIEAISRGANHVTAVEKNRSALSCIKENIRSLEIEEQTEIIPKDVFITLKSLQRQGRQFSIIFADPPYKEMILTKQGSLLLPQHLLNSIDQSSLLVENGSFFLEHAQELPINNSNLKQLELKSSRRTGSSVLNYYIKSSKQNS